MSEGGMRSAVVVVVVVVVVGVWCCALCFVL